MTIGSLSLYNSNGRIRGSYVYMVLCMEGETIFIKVGLTDIPLNRLSQIKTACPMRVRVFCTMQTHSRKQARIIEGAFLTALGRWRSNGEWFTLTMADKVAFNEACTVVLRNYSTASWPLKWVKLSVPKLQADANKRAGYAKLRFARMGKAEKDFKRDLQASGS